MRILLSALIAVSMPVMAQDAAPPVGAGARGSNARGSGAQGQVAVTIYNNDVALVQDVRALALPRGVSRQEFPDVSARIRPETVTLTGDGFGIVEQNFDYDLLSPESLLDKAVGQTVTLVRVNPGTGAETRETARVLANNDGLIVEVGGRIEVIQTGEGLPTRIIFPTLPPNLRARPTLSVTVDADAAGQRPMTLSYLTPGMSWRADYVARFDEAAGRIDVQGWITLNNTTGTTFTQAKTLLVAGTVAAEGQPGRPYPVRYGGPPPPPPGNRPGTESANRERLGDFYLYPLAARTTIANQQQKQVSFLDVSGVPASRGYAYRNDWLETKDEAESADTVLRFSSARAGGLGDALPAGIVRVYQRDAAGNPQFVGENRIGHTPMGSDLALKTGEAFDVKVQPVVEERTRIGTARWRTRMRYTLTNARPNPVRVDLVQAGFDWSDARIEAQSLASTRRSAEEVLWAVDVPANGTATVTATFDTRW